MAKLHSHLEDNLLDAKFNLPLCVHYGVGSVQQHLLNVGKPFDLLLLENKRLVVFRRILIFRCRDYGGAWHKLNNSLGCCGRGEGGWRGI